MKIIDLLTTSAARQPNTVAVKCGDIEVSYKQMLSDVTRLSEQLKCAGCRKGVKVAIVLNNSIEYLMSFFAVSGAGGIIVPFSAHMTVYEISRYIDRADVSIVITNRAYAKRLYDESDGSRKITVICVAYDINRKLQAESCISDCSEADEGDGDVALMVPTSGTTGAAKIVMLTDEQLISNMVSYRKLMGLDGHNVVYCALLLHHIYCICAQILTHISLADTFIVSDKPFFVKDFLKSVESEKVTITAFVPYMAMLLAEYPQPHEFNLDSLKYVTISGAKMPRSPYKVLTKKYDKVQFMNTYGMSEAGSRISIAAPFPNRFPIDSVGRPIPGVGVRIADEKGNEVAANCPGEILVKSSGVMKGYYKQQALTAETIAEDWLRTGDIGKVDEEGNLFILGRIKDIIISGGENICPLEIEECLIEHPAVREAAVVGQKDKLLQEVPCAFIVKKDTSEKPSPKDILDFCRGKLSSYKIPRSVRFLAELPKLSSSKVDRNALKRMADSPS